MCLTEELYNVIGYAVRITKLAELCDVDLRLSVKQLFEFTFYLLLACYTAIQYLVVVRLYVNFLLLFLCTLDVRRTAYCKGRN